MSGATPPNSGQSSLNLHQSHSLEGLGSKRRESSRSSIADRGDVPGDGVVGQRAAVFEVDELRAPGEHAAREPDGRGVEPHLEEGLLLEARIRRLARLVVDDAQGAVGSPVHAVDDPPDGQPRGKPGVDEGLAGGGLQERRVLHPEVVADQHARAVQPFGRAFAAADDAAIRRRRGQPLLPQGVEQGLCGRLGALQGGDVEEALQHRVDEGSAQRLRRRRLGEPVDHPEPEQERALFEVLGAGRRQRGVLAHGTTVQRASGGSLGLRRPRTYNGRP